MLNEGRIPLLAAETTALEHLANGYGQPVGFTRRDPGNTGPVLAEFPGGRVFEISENGETTEVTGG